MSPLLRQKLNSHANSGNCVSDYEGISKVQRKSLKRQWKKNDALIVELRDVYRMPSKYTDEAALVNTITDGMSNDDTVVQLSATRACRKSLVKAEESLIDNFISRGIIPRCIEFLSFYNNSAVQLEALQILGEVTSSTSQRTMAVVKNGAIPKLVTLLKSSVIDVVEHAVWTLGNIAGDCSEARNQVLRENCTSLLLNLIQPNVSVMLARNVVRLCANLCDNYEPPPPAETVETTLKIFNRLITVEHVEIHLHACRALLSLTREEHSRIQAVVDSGVIAKITPRLAFSHIPVVTSALEVLENIARGTQSQVDSIINAGGLERLKLLLKHKKGKIVKAAASIITRIFAGTCEQVQRIIDDGIFLPLYKVLVQGDGRNQDGDSADLAIANLVDDKSMSEIPRNIQHRLLIPFCRLVAANDEQITTRILDHLLKACNNTGIKQEPTKSNDGETYENI